MSDRGRAEVGRDGDEGMRRELTQEGNEMGGEVDVNVCAESRERCSCIIRVE